MSVRDLPGWIAELGKNREVAAGAGVLLRELNNRVGYLNEVGLGYLTLERQGRTLSGGGPSVSISRVRSGGAYCRGRFTRSVPNRPSGCMRATRGGCSAILRHLR